MEKNEKLRLIHKTGVIAIMRAQDPDQLPPRMRSGKGACG